MAERLSRKEEKYAQLSANLNRPEISIELDLLDNSGLYDLARVVKEDQYGNIKTCGVEFLSGVKRTNKLRESIITIKNDGEISSIDLYLDFLDLVTSVLGIKI